MPVDRKKFDLLVNDIKKKEGERAIRAVGENKKILNIKRWSTGIADLDSILDGGIPYGRMVQISGVAGSGKTTLLYHLLSLHELAVLMPIEGSQDDKRAIEFGSASENLVIYDPEHGDAAFLQTINFARAGAQLIAIDSVAPLKSYENTEKIEKALRTGKPEQMRVGGIGMLLYLYGQAATDAIELSGTTLILINQMRSKIGHTGYGDGLYCPGGESLKHYCGIRLRAARKAWIEVPNKNPSNSAEKERIGLIMKIKVERNKTATEGRECEIPLIFDTGFISFSEIEEHRKRIMQENREKYSKKAVE